MSLALLLDFVGEEAKAARVEAAVEADLASRGDAVRSTSQIGDALAAGAAG
jgi:3-isopropylmalate dehydrogenase